MNLKEFFHFRRDLLKRWRNRVRAGNLKSVPQRVREYMVK